MPSGPFIPQNPSSQGNNSGQGNYLMQMFQDLNMNPMELRELMQMERQGFQGPAMITPRQAAEAERARRRDRAEMAQKRNKVFGALGFVSPVFPLMNRLFGDTEHGGWGGGEAMSRLGDSVVERMQASSAINDWGGNLNPTQVTNRLFGRNRGGQVGNKDSFMANTYNAKADYAERMRVLNDFRQRGRQYWLQRMPNLLGNR